LEPAVSDADLGFEPLPEPTPEEGKPGESGTVPADDPTKEPASPEKPETSPAPETRRWAKKYDTPEAMEEGYLAGQAEGTRLAQENAQLKSELKGLREGKATATPKSGSEPKREYTAQELKAWKAEYRLQVADLTAQAREARRDGDQAQADKLMQQAVKANQQIDACDDELVRLAQHEREVAETQQLAKDGAVKKAKEVLTKLKPQLTEGSPLYNASGEVHNQLLVAGYPDNELTVAMAVTLAAQATGVAVPSTATTTPASPQKVMNDANKALRTVPQGAGGTSQTPKVVDSIDDFDTDEKFMEFDRKTYGVNW